MKIPGTLKQVMFAALALGLTAAASADDHGRHNETRAAAHGEMRVDSAYNHNHAYPVHGYVYGSLPYGYASYHYHNSPYYYHGGVWYRPYGPRFVVVAPPFGIGIGFLPPYYTTVWFGGIPYYYADHTYYQWYPQQREYVVTQPPGQPQQAQVGSTPPGSSTDVYVYPKNGQSEAQQSTDRYECHSWAVSQSGFDPTRPSGGVDESQIEAKRADYRRAEGACLEGRGYSVK
ncbi:MAG TPA: DUF6515 family protein [Steroidobacteraceae bacterium]|jgi:hypothetical protein|nr:DUF6515 family protein [Steroidobacteraceae bacterium]